MLLFVAPLIDTPPNRSLHTRLTGKYLAVVCGLTDQLTLLGTFSVSMTTRFPFSSR